MIRHSGTVGPLTPWMMRPTKSQVISGAMAAITEPTAIINIMPSRIFLRPTMSLRRGRKRENSAAAVKNQVWDRPITA
ncbi:hypothetical protein SRABI128_06330 [Microbacterium sp. Bi128]|nr:hypothetical protein SRABI128_06330 [Microbacterium sp. Bi128]